MTANSNQRSDQREKLQEILAEYLELSESGSEPDRKSLLARYPDFADQLAAFLDDRDSIEKFVAPLREKKKTAVEIEPTIGTEEASPPEPGEVVRYFGDYELLEEIARGGMGVVYKARQVSLNRIVALKMILAGQLASEQDVQRFHTEAEAAANLDHPNIVPIYEVGEHEGLHYFSMGFVDGHSLAERLAEGPLPSREAAELTKTLADAVAYAHEQGVIHRDLKPANVLIDSRGEPRITDFGLARREDDDSGMTATGQILGTPSYMPPEQALGKNEEIGPNVDVYALGATLYALLAGRPPFQGASIVETLKQLQEQEPVSPRQLNTSIASDLETICLKCLQKDATHRYHSASDLSAELTRYLNGQPIQARPIGRVSRTWRWCKRHQAVAALMFAVATLLLAGTSVATILAVVADRRADLARSEQLRANENANEAVREKNRAESQLDRAEWLLYANQISAAQAEIKESMRLRESALDLRTQINNEASARRRLHACRWDLRGWEHDYLFSLLNDPQQSWVYGQRIVGVAYSPNGMQMATVHRTGVIKIWDALNNLELFELIGDEDRATDLAFSPDGRSLASGTIRGKIKIWNLESRGVTLVLQGQGTAHRVAYSPDGKQIASTGEQGAAVWSLHDGELLLNLKHKGEVTSVAYRYDGKCIATAAAVDKKVKVWDSSTGKELISISLPDDTSIPRVLFSPNGKWLGTVNYRNSSTLLIFDAETGKLAREIDAKDGNLTSFGFSPDGQQIVTGNDDGSVKVWDTTTGKLIFTHQNLIVNQGHQETENKRGALTWVAFNPDGHHILAASEDGPSYFNVLDTQPINDAPSLKGRRSPITSVAFSPDDEHIASGSKDGSLRIWEAKTGSLLRVLQAHADEITCVAFNPNGSQFATGGADKTLNLWHADSGKLAFEAEFSAAVRKLAFSPRGDVIAAISLFELSVWDATSGGEIYKGRLPPLGVQTTALESGIRIVSGTNSGNGIVSSLVFAGRQSSDDGTLSTQRVPRNLNEEMNNFTGIALSPDGRTLLSGDWRGGVLRVWSIGDDQLLKEIDARATRLQYGREHRLKDLPEGPEFAGFSLAVSPDGKRFVSAMVDLNPNNLRYVQHFDLLHVWDAESGKRLQSLLGHGFGVTSVTFSNNGNHIASGGADGTLMVWDSHTGNRLLTCRPHKGHSDTISSLAFAPDGQRAVSASYDASLIIWDVASAKPLRRLEGHQGRVVTVAFSPDGRRIASGGEDMTVRVWDADDGSDLFVYREHEGGVGCVVFSPDGSRIASASSDMVSHVWDAKTGELLRTISTSESERDWNQYKSSSATGTVRNLCIAYSPDGRRLLAGGRIWDTTSGAKPISSGQEERLFRYLCLCAAFSPNAKRFVSGGIDRTVRIWDASTAKEIAVLQGHTGNVDKVAYSPDGSRIVSASLDKTIKLWDARNGYELLTLKGHAAPVRAVAFSPDGRTLLSGDEDGTIKFWQATQRDSTRTINAPYRIKNLVFSPNGEQIAVESTNETINIWDMRRGTETLRLEDTDSINPLLAFSGDGSALACLHYRGLTTWDLVTGKELSKASLARAGGHPANSSRFALHPDGTQYTNVSSDSILVADLSTDEHRVLRPPNNSLTSAAYSPSGRLIIGGDGKLAIVWDVSSGEELFRLAGHSEGINTVAFSPNGKRIGTGSHRGEIRIWDANDGKQLLSIAPSSNLRTPDMGSTNLAFSPDSRWVIRGAHFTPAIDIWNASTGEKLCTLRGRLPTIFPSGFVYVCFSPDGKLIAGVTEQGLAELFAFTPDQWFDKP